MSLILTSESNSPLNIECLSSPAGHITEESSIHIGKYIIDTHDFCQLIEYFFTVSDLRGDDERLRLLNRLCDLEMVEGFQSGKKRLGNS